MVFCSATKALPLSHLADKHVRKQKHTSEPEKNDSKRTLTTLKTMLKMKP